MKFILSATALSGVLAFVGLASVRAGGEVAPQPREVGKQVIPEAVFREIVSEANKFIQGPLAKSAASRGSCYLPVETTRANALLIALAAQNRMGSAGTGVEAAKLATLRDAAVELAKTLEKNPNDNPEALKYAAILNRFPDITPDPAASLAPIQFIPTFDHDDVASLFGGCGGNKTQRLEFHLFQAMRQKTPYTEVQAEKLELLVYKVALVGDLLRDMDNFIPSTSKNSVEKRKEWVSFATTVHQNSWQLIETTREGDSAKTQKAITKLVGSCTDCHVKFRD